MRFWWGECEEHDGSLKIYFRASFDGVVLWSELFLTDLESLAKFFDEPLVDLDSLGDFEWNDMVEIIG